MHTQELGVLPTRGRLSEVANRIIALRRLVYMRTTHVPLAVPHARCASEVTAVFALTSCMRPRLAFEAEGVWKHFTP